MPSPRIPEISLGQFVRERQYLARRVPLEGCIELTYRCNLRCAHCYINWPACHEAEARRELSRPEWERLIGEMADAGCLHLLLTGGEVLLRPDFPAIYRAALRQGLRVTVFTNGTLVTDRVMDLLAEYHPMGVEITLYGATQETHDRVTGVPGSYDLCWGGIRGLAARRVPLRLKAMALTWNRHEVGPLREIARSRGLEFRHDALLNARLHCGRDRHRELQLSAEEVVELDLADPDRREILQHALAEAARPGPGDGEERLYSCGAGQFMFTVDPHGGLHMCELSRRHPFDIRHGGFARGWNEHIPTLRRQSWSRPSPCSHCILSGVCGSCAGACELEHGDPERPIASFCRIAHRRAFALLPEFPGHRADAACCLGEGC